MKLNRIYQIPSGILYIDKIIRIENMNLTTGHKAADNIRALVVSMIERSQSGHPGGSMGGADYMHILYTEFLNFDPDNLSWIFRDRFFMDAGHLSTLQYAQLYLFGCYEKKDLENFRQWDSATPGHSEVNVKKGIENTSGPLGLGHTMGIGAAIAAKFLNARFEGLFDHKIYGFISDGGIQEEISQGAGRIAGHLGLSNYIMFYDANDVQLSTLVNEVSSEDTAKKYESWGWSVITIDGHNHQQIRQALKKAHSEEQKPTLIIGKTTMGKGCVDANGNKYEGYCELHGQPISKTGADYQKTLSNLGANSKYPFDIYKEVKVLYKNTIERKRKIILKKKKIFKVWKNNNPILAEKLFFFLSGKLPELDFSSIKHKPNISTRQASANVLGYLAENVENIIVSSADLSNSDKTDNFLKKTTAFKKNNFKGAFLHAGVSELTMAAIANGIMLHGGIIPIVATFFVFSDYMKPAIRMAALMELPVKYVFSHDAFRVGEDGPTHQPIEQEAQLRLLEKLKNHSNQNSMLVLRPADAVETVAAWKLALKNSKSPTALLLSRQNIKDIPSRNRYQDTMTKAQKGAYIIEDCEGKPDIILVANGSEVSTLIAGGKLLKKDGIKIRIVSAISEGLFRKQSQEYQDSILHPNIPVFGLTAGLSVTLEGFVRRNGGVHGVNHFGYSAPFTVLNHKFGFTAEQVRIKVRKFLR